MKKTIPLLFFAHQLLNVYSQKETCPDSKPEYRQFDFWIGEWKFSPKGNKAGDSKISLILDSCVILEEWDQCGYATGFDLFRQSFNSYNSYKTVAAKPGQTIPRNTTEYLQGEAGNGKIVYYADKGNRAL